MKVALPAAQLMCIRRLCLFRVPRRPVTILHGNLNITNSQSAWSVEEDRDGIEDIPGRETCVQPPFSPASSTVHSFDQPPNTGHPPTRYQLSATLVFLVPVRVGLPAHVCRPALVLLQTRSNDRLGLRLTPRLVTACAKKIPEHDCTISRYATPMPTIHT